MPKRAATVIAAATITAEAGGVETIVDCTGYRSCAPVHTGARVECLR